MSDLYWLTDEQMARLSPYFPKSHGKPRVDDRRVLSVNPFRGDHGFGRLIIGPNHASRQHQPRRQGNIARDDGLPPIRLVPLLSQTPGALF